MTDNWHHSKFNNDHSSLYNKIFQTEYSKLVIKCKMYNVEANWNRCTIEKNFFYQISDSTILQLKAK